MIIIKYPNNDSPQLEDIKNHISNMVLAHKMEHTPDLKDIELHDSDQQVIGYEAIIKYLQKLTIELKISYYCSFDKKLLEDLES